MADDETQGQQDTLWWSFDDFADPSLPTLSFDEPLVWPDALVWDDPDEAAPARAPVSITDAAFDDLFFPPASEPPAGVQPAAPPAPEEIDWGPPASDAPPDNAAADDPEAEARQSDPLGALGGGAGLAAAAGEATQAHRIDDSIWAPVAAVRGDDAVLVSTTPPPSPPSPVYTDTEAGPAGKSPRFGVRPGNVAVIALISLASLVLLGMFLSVRGRDNVRTDTSQTRTTSDGIEVTGTLNTVPLTTLDTGPPSTINIAELVPADDAAGDVSAPATTAARSTTATTAAPTATTARPTQPTTATTAAPAATATTAESTTTPPTSPPTSEVTTIKRTTTSFTIPATTRPSTPFPSIPGVSFPSSN